jgi:hypothetical protein
MAFALLEDFIKARTGEILERVGAGLATFVDLPHALRVAATAGVVRALYYQDRFQDKQSSIYFTHYQVHSSRIASTASSAFEISPLAFGFDQPNLNSKVVENILNAFNIEQPWNAIESVARRTGVGVPALRRAFESAMYRRHDAAHRADADVESSDLEGLVTEVLGIAVGTDLSLSLALRRILDGDRDLLSRNKKMAGNKIGVRLISFDGSTWWREVVPGKSRATARNKDLDELKVECFRRARSNQEAVVIQDSRGLPQEWYTPFVD